MGEGADTCNIITLKMKQQDNEGEGGRYTKRQPRNSSIIAYTFFLASLPRRRYTVQLQHEEHINTIQKTTE